MRLPRCRIAHLAGEVHHRISRTMRSHRTGSAHQRRERLGLKYYSSVTQGRHLGTFSALPGSVGARGEIHPSGLHCFGAKLRKIPQRSRPCHRRAMIEHGERMLAMACQNGAPSQFGAMCAKPHGKGPGGPTMPSAQKASLESARRA